MRPEPGKKAAEKVMRALKLTGKDFSRRNQAYREGVVFERFKSEVEDHSSPRVEAVP